MDQVAKMRLAQGLRVLVVSQAVEHEVIARSAIGSSQRLQHSHYVLQVAEVVAGSVQVASTEKKS